jgi:hypothetical protein
MSEPIEAVMSEFVHETYGNDAPTGTTENPDAVSILLDQTVLQKFVGESGLVYYKCAFEKLIDAYGIRNSKLSDVDDKQLRQIAFRRGSKERWNARLPFVKDTTWNWSAFFFGIFWAVWRGIAYRWWIFAVWVVGVVINSGSVVLPSLAVAIFLGASGNPLFLNQVLRELKLGSVRAQPSFALRLWVPAVTGLVLIVGFGFNVAPKSNVTDTVHTQVTKTLSNEPLVSVSKTNPTSTPRFVQTSPTGTPLTEEQFRAMSPEMQRTVRGNPGLIAAIDALTDARIRALGVDDSFIDAEMAIGQMMTGITVRNLIKRDLHVPMDSSQGSGGGAGFPELVKVEKNDVSYKIILDTSRKVGALQCASCSVTYSFTYIAGPQPVALLYRLDLGGYGKITSVQGPELLQTMQDFSRMRF